MKRSLRCLLGSHEFERTYRSRTENSDFYDFGATAKWSVRKQDEIRCSRCGITFWRTIDHEVRSSNVSSELCWVRGQIARLTTTKTEEASEE